MLKLDEHDLFLVQRRLPSAVVKAIKAQNTKVFIAGGFIRSVVAREEPSDIDLFVPTKMAASQLAIDLMRFRPRHQEWLEVNTDNAITLYGGKLPIQIITRWTYEAPFELVSSFDFTVCQAAVWCEYSSEKKKFTWHSLTGDRFYIDLASKRLTYTAPKRIEEAGGSMLRVLKYYRRGYTIPLKDLGRVIARLDSGVKTKEAGLAAQGEEGLAMVYCGLLREVDPLIDPDRIIQDKDTEDGEGQNHQTETD